MGDHWDEMLAGLAKLERETAAAAPADQFERSLQAIERDAGVEAGAGEVPRQPRQITVHGVPPASAPMAELVGRLYGELVATRRKLDALEQALDAANVAVYRMIRLLREELGIIDAPSAGE